MQGKLAIVIDDRMTGIGTALETNDNIRGFGEQIGDLTLALVAPVGADDRFYHIDTSAAGIRNPMVSPGDLPFPSPLFL